MGISINMLPIAKVTPHRDQFWNQSSSIFNEREKMVCVPKYDAKLSAKEGKKTEGSKRHQSSAAGPPCSRLLRSLVIKNRVISKHRGLQKIIMCLWQGGGHMCGREGR